MGVLAMLQASCSTKPPSQAQINNQERPGQNGSAGNASTELFNQAPFPGPGGTAFGLKTNPEGDDPIGAYAVFSISAFMVEPQVSLEAIRNPGVDNGERGRVESVRPGVVPRVAVVVSCRPGSPARGSVGSGRGTRGVDVASLCVRVAGGASVSGGEGGWVVTSTLDSQARPMQSVPPEDSGSLVTPDGNGLVVASTLDSQGRSMRSKTVQTEMLGASAAAGLISSGLGRTRFDGFHLTKMQSQLALRSAASYPFESLKRREHSPSPGPKVQAHSPHTKNTPQVLKSSVPLASKQSSEVDEQLARHSSRSDILAGIPGGSGGSIASGNTAHSKEQSPVLRLQNTDTLAPKTTTLQSVLSRIYALDLRKSITQSHPSEVSTDLGPQPLVLYRGLRATEVAINPVTNRLAYSGAPLAMAKVVGDAGAGGMVTLSQAALDQLHKLDQPSQLKQPPIIWSLGQFTLKEGMPPVKMFQAFSLRFMAGVVAMPPLRVKEILRPGVLSAPIGNLAVVRVNMVGFKSIAAWDAKEADLALSVFEGYCHKLANQFGGYMAYSLPGSSMAAFSSPCAAANWALNLLDLMMHHDW
eukprot:gene11698-34424_t